MFETLFFLAIFGGGGYGLYKDSHRGFATTRMLIERVSGGKIRFAQSKETKSLFIAEKAVEDTGKTVHALRESIAEIDANQKMALKESAEQAQLAMGFRDILDRIVNDRTKQEEAQVAAVAMVEAEKRAKLFTNLAHEQARILSGLRKQLDSAEMELDVARTKATTISVFVSITQSWKSLYALQSNVGGDGFTPKGELDNAMYDAEKEMIKSASLLEMANRNNGSRAKLLLQTLEVDDEIAKSRARVTAAPLREDNSQDVFDANAVDSEAVS